MLAGVTETFHLSLRVYIMNQRAIGVGMMMTLRRRADKSGCSVEKESADTEEKN